jgi:hypothetical protein
VYVFQNPKPVTRPTPVVFPFKIVMSLVYLGSAICCTRKPPFQASEIGGKRPATVDK